MLFDCVRVIEISWCRLQSASLTSEIDALLQRVTALTNDHSDDTDDDNVALRGVRRAALGALLCAAYVRVECHALIAMLLQIAAQHIDTTIRRNTKRVFAVACACSARARRVGTRRRQRVSQCDETERVRRRDRRGDCCWRRQ
jgi:hypothetical protein